MEIRLKDITPELLKRYRPDLVTAIQRPITMQEERKNITAIVKYMHRNLSGVAVDLILSEAIQKGLSLLEFQKKVESLIINNGLKARDGSQLNHLDRAKIYQSVHGGSTTAALSATADPRVVKTGV